MSLLEIGINVPAGSGYQGSPELEALRQAKPTGRPGLMLYEGLSQDVDPLLEQLSSEPARNFLFGNTVLHLGFPEGESGLAATVHKFSGALLTWEVIFRRFITDQVSGIKTERLSIRPTQNMGKQGKAEIKIPSSDQPALIMMPGKHFTPMTRIAKPLSEVLGATIRPEPQPPQLTVVR